MSARPAGDQRPVWLRVLLVLGWAVLTAIGLPLTAIGLVGVGDRTGQAFLCLGLVLLLSAAGGVAREVAEARHRRRPPAPRLVELDRGERALFLPRSAGPSRVASRVLLGYGVVALLGAGFSALAQEWGWTVVLALAAVALTWVAAPRRDLAGGMWFTPRRLVHEHDGLRWEVAWEDVTGVVPQQPMPVLVRPERRPDVQRVGPWGRAWQPRRRDGVLAVDTRFLAGGATLASYVIARAVTDPSLRAVLGAPESLPPA